MHSRRVVVRRSGDVIPQVMQVLREFRPTASQQEQQGETSSSSIHKRFEVPSGCPSCGSKLQSGENGDVLKCSNAACPAQAVRGLEFYANTLCKGLSKGT